MRGDEIDVGLYRGIERFPLRLQILDAVGEHLPGRGVHECPADISIRTLREDRGGPGFLVEGNKSRLVAAARIDAIKRLARDIETGHRRGQSVVSWYGRERMHCAVRAKP